MLSFGLRTHTVALVCGNGDRGGGQPCPETAGLLLSYEPHVTPFNMRWPLDHVQTCEPLASRVLSPVLRGTPSIPLFKTLYH